MIINKILNLGSRLFVPIALIMGVIFYYTGTDGDFFGENVGATYYVVHPVSLVIIILSVYLSIIEIIKWRKETLRNSHKIKSNPELFKVMKSVLIFIACVLVYLFLLKYVGFIVSTFIYLIITFYAFKMRKIIPLLAFSIGLTLLAYIIFNVFFDVPLP